MATDSNKGDGRTVQLKRVRLSFTNRLKDKATTSAESDKETHGCNFILEADQPEFEANNAKVVGALKEAGLQAFKNEDAYKTIAEDAPKRVCYRKGEKWKNKEGKVYAGYEGNRAVTANGPSGGTKRPKLLDRRKRVLRDQATGEQIKANMVFGEGEILDIFYGGCYADVILSFYGTDKGSRGIFCSIEAIRSHENGERMGGGIYVDADDFDNLEDDDTFDSGPSQSGKSSESDDLLL
ncbi:ssDNA-binding protein [Mesorhizobium sp. INR15]|uniref:ssDNA-binding protein n=1 Tax=Mesorhizobium sp. INR15 TaxID=2654248 RepID=UPI00189679B6|nr:ssDNA-binding protein [Mesorhizobium sp. INR15]QPC91502.1 DUF2815 family protein [Mesorhizobium sp. INR15]